MYSFSVFCIILATAFFLVQTFGHPAEKCNEIDDGIEIVPDRQSCSEGQHISNLPNGDCALRPVLITVPNNESRKFEPNVVSVQRCGGWCTSGGSCKPSEKKITELVIRYSAPTDDYLNNRNCAVVRVVEHVACNCTMCSWRRK